MKVWFQISDFISKYYISRLVLQIKCHSCNFFSLTFQKLQMQVSSKSNKHKMECLRNTNGRWAHLKNAHFREALNLHQFKNINPFVSRTQCNILLKLSSFNHCFAHIILSGSCVVKLWNESPKHNVNIAKKTELLLQHMHFHTCILKYFLLTFAIVALWH